MPREFWIDKRPIGPDHPPYLICEVSANHNGSLDRMLATIDAAAATGCDAIKVQSYTPDTMTLDCERPEYQITDGPWAGRSLYQLYQEAQTPFEWHEAIFARARELGVTLFSTPFDDSAAELLAGLGASAFKIASFELVDLPLIAEVAHYGKPMILSTGLAALSEIEAAIDTARRAGCDHIALLHCVSAYPAPVEASNLRTMESLSKAFDVIVGLSDHSKGTAVATAAVALGASIIEKHFTLSRADGGPDADFSLEPEEFVQLTSDCNTAWKAIGAVRHGAQKAELENLQFRRSLCAITDIKAGQTFSLQNIRSIRPGFGLPPSHLTEVIGCEATVDIPRGAPLDWTVVQSRRRRNRDEPGASG
ncbi:MAG: pseudaminic acid synthase [Hyphomicrobiales bacterium]|nr:pseudaminic acid synthase [Hyphomicrobiales bacterium]